MSSQRYIITARFNHSHTLIYWHFISASNIYRINDSSHNCFLCSSYTMPCQLLIIVRFQTLVSSRGDIWFNSILWCLPGKQRSTELPSAADSDRSPDRSDGITVWKEQEAHARRARFLHLNCHANQHRSACFRNDRSFWSAKDQLN